MDNKNNNYIDEDFIMESKGKSIIDKIFVVLSKIIGICALILLIDFAYTLVFSDKPLLTIKEEDNKYSSLLYDVYICDNNKVIKFKTIKYSCPLSNEDFSSSIDYSSKDNKIDDKNMSKITEDKDKNDDKDTKEDTNGINKDDNIVIYNKSEDITIIDNSEGKYCAEAIEYYYEDESYKYYFTCIKSQYVYIVTGNKRYNIKEALKNNIVTMEKIINTGYKVLKEDKSLVSE